MRTIRRLKSALLQVLKERRRITITVAVALLSFALGAWLPEERVLTGAAVAAAAVAFTQLVFYIFDNGKSDQKPGTNQEE
ncbi:hypothetical protein [Streptomyces herbicida]|uniref:hypothetical protein n=1 Tax=Streptomyces herbicida TaxID=3065675 RepID=UPI00292E951F|nr:hypothetical protein [Streptomyces sp. NEAU-HV9]